MKKKQLLLSFLLILLCFCPFFLWFTTARSVQVIQEDLSANILRFHVLANSDSEEDQTLKLEVKTAVVEYLEKGIVK